MIEAEKKQLAKENIEDIQDFISVIKKEHKELSLGELSDGHHTFNELYEFRMLYNAAFFNELAKNMSILVYKSKKHTDGELCFGGGWFIVVAELPTGQISNHYEMKDWDYFNIQEFDIPATEFDGHTSGDVVERIKNYLL